LIALHTGLRHMTGIAEDVTSAQDNVICSA